MSALSPELISVIIPVFNNAEGLRSCLAALRAQDDPCYEVIVADDASSVDLAPLCAQAGARHCKLPENRGPGEARNAGARIAKGSILAFTDSDCVPPPGWLSRIRRTLDEPGVVATAGTYGEDLSRTFFARMRLLEARFYHIRDRTLVNSYVSANFAIRKDVFDRVGGFPPLRIGEDLLLGYRLKQTGHGILWDCDLKVSQYFRETGWAYVKQQRAWSAGAFRLQVLYPGIRGLAWSVRRGTLAPQVPLHALFLGGCASGLIAPALWPLPALCAVGMFGLNLPFVAEVARREGLGRALAVFGAAWWIRDTAWLWGISQSALADPVGTARFLLRLRAEETPEVHPC